MGRVDLSRTWELSNHILLVKLETVNLLKATKRRERNVEGIEVSRVFSGIVFQGSYTFQILQRYYIIFYWTPALAEVPFEFSCVCPFATQDHRNGSSLFSDFLHEVR